MNNEEIKNRLKEEWDYEKNNGLIIDDFSLGSHKKVWWKCKKGHSWEAELKSRVRTNCGCPYCSGKKAVKGVNDFITLYPELAKEISPNNININLYGGTYVSPLLF